MNHLIELTMVQEMNCFMKQAMRDDPDRRVVTRREGMKTWHNMSSAL